jgi:hypothetical protein
MPVLRTARTNRVMINQRNSGVKSLALTNKTMNLTIKNAGNSMDTVDLPDYRILFDNKLM